MLSKPQMTAIVQDEMGLGNLQPLPQALNASKGSKIGWYGFKKQELPGDYTAWLEINQEANRKLTQEQTHIYQLANRKGDM